MKTRKQLISIFMALALLAAMILPASASIDPDSLIGVLAAGEFISETKTVTIPELAPKVDVVFAFDLTGSMGDIIDTAKSNAVAIMTLLNDDPLVDVQFGVMSYMDYPDYYLSCGYGANYGDPDWGDYAYSLDQSVTPDVLAVNNAINDLTLGSGWDGPQDYTRIFYESYADANVDWRPGAKRILLNFGDNVPHDCDLNLDVPGKSGVWSKGCDPGRDEIAGTGDDLVLLTVLGEMASAGVVLLEAHTTTSYNEYWTYWTGLTGGEVFITTSSTLVDDIVANVNSALLTPTVNGLHLEASSPFGGWLGVDPPTSYDGLLEGAVVTFDITVTVPGDQEPGVYNFTISALDEFGVSYGDQDVTIIVYDPSAGFVTGGGFIDSPAGAYNPEYLPLFDGSYYELVFVNPPVGWVAASDLAAASGVDSCTSAHLATVTSAEEQAIIADLMEPVSANAWLGGFQDEFELSITENWEWVTGETWGYSNWASGEPNDNPYGTEIPGSEQNLETYQGSGLWNDAPIDEPKYYYIVEYEGCYLPTGTANFGFVSKYKKGATEPDGSTEFQFQAGGLNFHSSSYDWLVVTGSDYARFKGTGTINGEGDYKFMLWAGDDAPDTFRIKIWQEIGGIEDVIYDNGMDQAITGGSIVIHTKK